MYCRFIFHMLTVNFLPHLQDWLYFLHVTDFILDASVMWVRINPVQMS